MSSLDLFITCSQGLEEILCEELSSFGYNENRSGYRGVYATVPDFNAIYRINYCSRIAGRVLLPIKRFKCFDDSSLYQAASEIDWKRYFSKQTTFAIDANVSHRLLRNSLFAAQVVKDAICDQLREKTGSRPNVDTSNPDIQLNLFMQEEKAVISFDTSGSPLHKRGYRQETVEAPVQESLAAAFLYLAKYDGSEILCDPCCGSGTILIEAALIASKTPPGFLRKKWGFTQLPEFSNDDWLKVKNEADQGRVPLQKGRIFGADIGKNAVRAATINFRAAGFQQEIEVIQNDFRDYNPPIPPQIIVTNPPHGKRLNDVDLLKSFYRSLGDFMKQKSAKPGRGFVFTGSLELAKEVGLAAKKRYVINNSGVDSRLLEYELF